MKPALGRVEEITRAATPASRLEQARQALSTAEREETEERQKLSLLEWREEQLGLEVRRGTEKAMAPDAIQMARSGLDDLSHRREQLARQKAEQWKVVREVRERLHAARRSYERLQRHAVELQHAIRREERAVAHWQREIKTAEEQLARWQRVLTEAQARLEQAQRELGELSGFQEARLR